MGGIETFLAASSMILQNDAMDDRARRQNRQAQYKRQELLAQKKVEMARKRAARHARGFGGRTLNKSLENMENNYNAKMGNIYGASDNTLGKVNLLSKAIRTFGKDINV